MKSKISGWQDVFRFTLVQTLKSRAFLASFAVMMVIGIVSMPLMSMIQGGGEEVESHQIAKLYVYDETGLVGQSMGQAVGQIDLEKALADAGWDTEVVFCDPAAYGTPEYDELIQEIDTVRTKEMVLWIAEEEGIQALHFQGSSEGDISSAEADSFIQVVSGCYTEAKYAALNLTEEQKQLLNATVTTRVSKVNLSGEFQIEEDTSISSMEYWFIYGLLFVIMMICTMTGSQVANAIVIEKSSKVVEYLLTSIRPLAIIVGKVLAMLCAVIGEVLCLLLTFAVSNYVTEHYINGGESILETYLTPELLGSLNIINVILCLLFVALGLIFYATLAGLAGATVSKMEEAGESLVVFTVAVLVGAYVGIGAAGTLLGAGENAFVSFALLFPLSSPFILPGAILIGKAQIWIIAASLALLVVVNILLFAFVARVYEALIVHNGNRIGIKQLVKMK